MQSVKNPLKSLVKKLVKPEAVWPEPPAEALDKQYSMVFSLDDDPHPPTRRLIDLALQTVQVALSDRVDLNDLAARAGKDYFPNLFPGEHYKLLAAFMLTLRPTTVIEVGTFTGLSSLCMKKFLPPGGRVITFDLKPWKTFTGETPTILTDDDFADGRLVQHLGNLADLAFVEQHRAELEASEFLFIDGPKDYVTEYQFIENFRKLNFKTPPILLFDDTRLWSMLRFWRTLAYPKLDLTSFGHWSGTGLIEWPAK